VVEDVSVPKISLLRLRRKTDVEEALVEREGGGWDFNEYSTITPQELNVDSCVHAFFPGFALRR